MNLEIFAEREEHDASPVSKYFLFGEFQCSGELGFFQGLETQVSACVPVLMCGCMKSVTTRLCEIKCRGWNSNAKYGWRCRNPFLCLLMHVTYACSCSCTCPA